MFWELLTPIHKKLYENLQLNHAQTLAHRISFHTDDEYPSLDDVQIALIGVLDSRGLNDELVPDLTDVREKFYKLFPGNWTVNVADLGDVKAGANVSDTYFAVRTIVTSLVKQHIIPVIIGGSQDLTYAMYRAYDQLDQMVNLVTVDPKFDLGQDGNSALSDTYLSKIIMDEPNNLFNYALLGYQSYFCSQESIDLMDKMWFECYRLGEINANITLAEPVMRDADIVSVDLTSLRSSDSGNFYTFAPNGFSGKEVCALARYAGISDKVSSFGLFNGFFGGNESMLIAQVLWYFIEGFNCRTKDYPFSTTDRYTKFHVLVDDQPLVFYKSNKSDRWWIEMSNMTDLDTKYRFHTLLPCAYEDYLNACNQITPERWYKAHRKTLL